MTRRSLGRSVTRSLKVPIHRQTKLRPKVATKRPQRHWPELLQPRPSRPIRPSALRIHLLYAGLLHRALLQVLLHLLGIACAGSTPGENVVQFRRHEPACDQAGSPRIVELVESPRPSEEAAPLDLSSKAARNRAAMTPTAAACAEVTQAGATRWRARTTTGHRPRPPRPPPRPPPR